MEDFVLLFRQPDTYSYNRTPGDFEAAMLRWDAWFNALEADGKLVNNGIQLARTGKVLKAGGVVTDGPFVEIRERLNGFIVIKAESLDDAITLAHGCPIYASTRFAWGECSRNTKGLTGPGPMLCWR
jgi:hypothetical protein